MLPKVEPEPVAVLLVGGVWVIGLGGLVRGSCCWAGKDEG